MTHFDTFNLLSTLLSPLSDDQALHKWQLNTLSQEDWGLLVKRASGHLVTPSLYCMCRDKGLLAQLPEELQEYLENIYQLNLARNQAIRSQALEVIGILNQVGIEPILLKGIASLLTDLYPDLGMRVLSDIDILIPPDYLAKAEAALCANGYYCVPEFDDHAFDAHHHSCPLIKKGYPTKIELHHRLTGFSKHSELLNSKNHWQAAQTLVIDNLRCFVLSPETRLLHNFYHTQIQDGNFYRSTIQLRQLLECLWLRQHYDQQINWTDLQKDIKQHHLTIAFTAYLLNAQINLGQSLPIDVTPDFIAKLHIKKERLFKCYPKLRHSVQVMLYCTTGICQIFSRRLIQIRHGKVSLVQGWWLRLGDLITPSWYKTRWSIIKQLAGF